MRRLLQRLAGRFGPALLSDTAFIEQAYRQILGRVPDQEGMDHYTRVLRKGRGRTSVLIEIARSEESADKLTRVRSKSLLPDLRGLRPDRYRTDVDRTNGDTVTVFDAAGAADFDWLEEAILENRYYEQPGVWTLDIDVDKRVIAEIVASFAPSRPIEMGCAAGAVLDCLQDLGIAGEGIEISSMAIARATSRVRPQIHAGDLLSLDLGADYDLAFGLDIFEHLNPNRLAAYIERLARITTPEAQLFVNVPAFGADPVFGTAFPLYLDGWQRKAAQGLPFSTIHVDERGYPIHGHLVWADSAWWVRQFEACGFAREVEMEREIHRKYDKYMQSRTPARRAFYVFSKTPDPTRRGQVIARIRKPSAALVGTGLS